MAHSPFETTTMSSTSTSRPTTVFDIPLLVQAIAVHLQKHDLLHCCLVNHTWSNMFLPQLWRDFSFWDLLPRNNHITLGRFTADPNLYTRLHRDTLARNAPSVRILDVPSSVIQDGFLSGGTHPGSVALKELRCILARAETSVEIPLDAENLFSLDYEEPKEEVFLQPILDLVHQNQSSLCLLGFTRLILNTAQQVQSLTRVFQSLPVLESLSIHFGQSLAGEFLQDLLAAVPESCRTFTVVVDLGNGAMAPVARIPQEADQGKHPLVNLHSFKLQTRMLANEETTVLVPFLQRLPNLRFIHLPEMWHQQGLQFVAKTLAKFCPKIDDLDLNGFLFKPAHHALVSVGCRGLRKITCLNMNNCREYEDSPNWQRLVDALMVHSWNTLEEIDVGYGADSLNGKDLRMIVMSCSKLKSLTVRQLEMSEMQNMVMGVDIEENRSWACASTLERLDLRLEDYSSHPTDFRTMDKAKIMAILNSTEADIQEHWDSNTGGEVDYSAFRIFWIQSQRTIALAMLQLLRRTGELSRLKALHLPIEVPCAQTDRAPLFALLKVYTGLEYLGNLDQLEELNVNLTHGYGLDRMWGQEEVEWMTEPGRWPRLKKIQGWVRKHRGQADPEQDRQWIEMFRARRPMVVVE